MTDTNNIPRATGCALGRLCALGPTEQLLHKATLPRPGDIANLSNT